MAGEQQRREVFASIVRMAEEIIAAGPRCHGRDHTMRVLANARRIRAAEGGDAFVVDCAAVLHDIGRADEDDAGKTGCHAEAGAERCRDLLREAGVAEDTLIDHVAACVLTHRYRRREQRPPETREARIVFDADKLDSLGAVGVGRAFHFAGRIGARVHNTAAEALAGEAYGPEDTALREYLVKLRHLPASLLTGAGRRMAHERFTYMREFFARLDEETGTGHSSRM